MLALTATMDSTPAQILAAALILVGLAVLAALYWRARGGHPSSPPGAARSPGSIRGWGGRYRRLREQTEALERDRERADMAAQSAGLGLWDWNLEAGTVFVDERWLAILGYSPGELEATWEQWRALVHPEDLGGFRALRETPSSPAGAVSREYRMRARDGAWKWVLCRGEVQERSADGKPLRVTGSHLDITDQKRVEETLRQSEGQLRRLAARLEAIREEERKAISQEIHDELGQALTGLKMDLAWLDGQMGARPELSARVRSMIRQVDGTVAAVRDLSSRLRPAVLDDLGLCEAVEWQVEDFERRSGLECAVAISVDDRQIQADRSIALFRILQESLTNVARHARASRVAVELSGERGQLVLKVSDDGRGIENTELGGEGTLGLLGMKERAAGLGGTFEIGRGADGGAAVTVRVPL